MEQVVDVTHVTWQLQLMMLVQLVLHSLVFDIDDFFCVFFYFIVTDVEPVISNVGLVI